MNILHVFPSQYSGGSELCAFETIKTLDAAGYINYAVFPANGSIVSKTNRYLKDKAIIPNSWWMSDPLWNGILKIKMLRGFFAAAWRIKKYIKHNKIDLVITHSVVVPSGAFAAMQARVPHVWYLHEYGDMDHQLKFNYGKRLTLRLINFFSDQILVNSKALQLYFNTYFQTAKIQQLYYVVEYPESDPMQRKNKDALTICMVGRIAAGKNQLIALKALGLLKQENMLPRIIFVGGMDASYKATLDAYAATHGLCAQITYTGQTDKPAAYVQAADCVLVCSKNEAFGRVTVEAMKSGVITIASKTGAGKELIEHGVTGFLFNPEDEQELALLLKRIWQTEDVRVITTQAQNFARKHFNADTHLQSLQQVINKYK